MNECIVSDGLNSVFVVEKCNEICANMIRVGIGERAREDRIASEASRGTIRRCHGSPASCYNYFDLHTHLTSAIDYNSRDLTCRTCARRNECAYNACSSWRYRRIVNTLCMLYCAVTCLKFVLNINIL